MTIEERLEALEKEVQQLKDVQAIKELKKKELLKKFRDDFVQNFKYAKETSYFEMMPKMQRTIWGVFYHVPAFYNLILSLRS